MGVDLIGVVNHRLSKEELRNFPSVVDTWSEIEDTIRKELPKTYSQEYIDKEYKRIKASYFDLNMHDIKSSTNPNAEYIEYVWNQWEEPNVKELPTIQVVSYFSNLKIGKNTIVIEQMPWHKYSNLDDKEMAGMILELNRIIARKLKQSRIIYFADSAYPTSILYEYALEGNTVEELIEIGDSEFSNRPTDLKEGIKFKYFVDAMDQDLSSLDNLHNSEDYWKWNHDNREYVRIK